MHSQSLQPGLMHKRAVRHLALSGTTLADSGSAPATESEVASGPAGRVSRSIFKRLTTWRHCWKGIPLLNSRKRRSHLCVW